MQMNDIDMEKRKMLLRDFQNGLTRLQAKENIVAKFGNCVGYGERTCDRWFTKFRRGNFDLTKKPRDKLKKNRDYYRKKSKRSTKTVKANEVKLTQQELPTPTNSEVNSTVQNLIKSKPGITISKVPSNSGAVVKKLPSESSTVTRRLLTPSTVRTPDPNTAAQTKKVTKETNAVPPEMPKLRPRRPRSKGIEIQLPVSAAKRMHPQTMTENHNIGEGSKRSTSTETAKDKNSATLTQTPATREVTVQFQNITPEIAKNTVRKHTYAIKRKTPIQVKPQHSMLKIANVAHVDNLSPEKNMTTDQSIAEVPTKRPTLPQPSPLTNQKGIIYLNPQEIFPKSFGGINNSMKLPSSYLKSAQQIHKKPKPSIHHQQPTILHPPPERQESVALCDSDDSGEDILFPENIPLPAPKLKADSTYTTYWDMESGQPISGVNAAERVLPQTAIPVIEID